MWRHGRGGSPWSGRGSCRAMTTTGLSPPPPAPVVRKIAKEEGEGNGGVRIRQGQSSLGGEGRGHGKRQGQYSGGCSHCEQTMMTTTGRRGGRLTTWARGRLLQSAVAILGMNVSLYIVNHHSHLHFRHAQRLIQLCPSLHPPRHQRHPLLCRQKCWGHKEKRRKKEGAWRAAGPIRWRLLPLRTNNDDDNWPGGEDD